ncbi:hypothetical protein D9756_006608 [Leucocoprinus leucothites]|uniref:DUF155 domain-containing protein n=1 Tax=Leucocoprinus leucothites TaxID=201217 RepID=A0A8H5G2Q0_9AGAR|nr:hypothetical protein D9756_006608 [Leucoagaricus leucothites]
MENAPHQLVRDDQFYFEDGNCIIQVENRLFNDLDALISTPHQLHRFILRRDSTVFQDMFLASKSIEDDPGTAVVEGTSDEHPIVCDDTTESFRALCRVLYVGFNEFEAGVDKTIANFTVEEFAHIASLAHKYQCEKIEPWALNLFERKLGELNNARQPGVPPLPRELLEYFIRTSIRCGWSGSPVRGTSEDLLLETIFHPSGDSSIPKQSQEGRSLSVVLEFSESIGSNELKARAYYTFLASVGWCLAPRIRSSRLIEVPNSYHPRAYSRAINLDTLDDNEAVPFQKWDSLGALTDEQKTCLIHGLHLISALRKELQGIPSVSHLQSHGSRRRPPTRLAALGTSGQRLPGPSTGTSKRRASVSGLTAAPKTQRTSKTTHKLVVLPSAPQTRPLLPSDEEDLTLGVVTDGGIREYKSEAERMTKEQRKQAGFKRLAAYCVAESFKMKLLASFLKREHNVAPRIFDEALYAMYHLPLLPGRSSIDMRDGYISSTSPVLTRSEPAIAVSLPSEAESLNLVADTQVEVERRSPVLFSETELWTDNELIPESGGQWQRRPKDTVPPVTPPPQPEPSPMKPTEDDIVEVVFFEYGVVVFFGLTEGQERDILEDIENAGIMKRKINDDDWEIEECHFTHDPFISYPRIYNDFFTLKSRSHLLKLSIAHALAQSTLLAHYETIAQRVLLSPQTLAIPQQLASSGSLQLRRHEALKLTGKLFKLRRDVNLVSNVLDVPELFWTEASLGDLYDAVREYMEIGGRVQSLNEKLGVASDFLDAIHDHLNNSAMERITWIVIWLIVVAILVELGEVIARLVVHATVEGGNSKNKANLTAMAVRSFISSVSTPSAGAQVPMQEISKEEVLRTLERLMAG